MEAQKFVLNTNEIEATLSIEPFTDMDSVILANIAINNISSEKIYVPVKTDVKPSPSLDYYFFYIGNRLYYLFGGSESFLGPTDLGGWVRVEVLPSKATKTISIALAAKDLTNFSAIRDIKKADIQEVIFQFDYLTSKKAKRIIRHFDDGMMIKSIDYIDKCVYLRFSAQTPSCSNTAKNKKEN